MDINCGLVTVLLLATSTPISACLFGSSEDCTFRCRCARNVPCDVTTGQCPGQCEAGLLQPFDNVTRFDWRGPACQIGNVALSKSAEQSGVWDDLVAGYAVDGRLGGGYDDANCAHPATGSGSLAWWRVDLGSIHAVHNVTVFNTINGGGYRRLSDFGIGVGNTTTITEHTTCASYGSPAVDPGGNVTLTCNAPLYGRYVSFTRTGGYQPNLVTICEFVIMGYKQTYTDCDKCAGSCDDILGCRECTPSYTNAPFCNEAETYTPTSTTVPSTISTISSTDPTSATSTTTISASRSSSGIGIGSSSTATKMSPTTYIDAAVHSSQVASGTVIIVLAILLSASLLVIVVLVAYILRIRVHKGKNEKHKTPLSADDYINKSMDGPPSTGDYEGLEMDTQRQVNPSQYSMIMTQREDGGYENVRGWKP